MLFGIFLLYWWGQKMIFGIVVNHGFGKNLLYRVTLGGGEMFFHKSCHLIHISRNAGDFLKLDIINAGNAGENAV